MKHSNAVKKFGATLTGMAASGSALAADYTSLVSEADWATAATAVITVFAAVAVVLVAITGGRMVLRAFSK